ncbi:MAG TPA: dienelactone hydrolase family protein [Steroidobacteraceae bacterium]
MEHLYMGEFQTLMARDGHNFSAYLAPPKGQPRGAVVVIQEIFGVNRHIRAVTDGYAEQGYVAIAPALFDRIKRGIELGYTPPEIQQGVGYMMQITPEHLLADLNAAIAVVKHAGRVGMVGYCWGGTVSYIAACELPIACAVAYYGGSIVQKLDKHPKRPVMYHFGEKDTHIPLSAIDKIKAADPNGIFYLYPAGHGFNCTDRADYDPASATLALERSLAFLAKYLEAGAKPPNVGK